MYSVRVKPMLVSKRWKAPVTPASRKISITNLVTNGDFSDGTTGWAASGVSSIAVADSILSVTCGASSSGQANSAHHLFVDGDVYYFKAFLRVTNAVASYIRFYAAGGWYTMQQVSPVENEWYELSFLHTIGVDEGTNDDIANLSHGYPSAEIANGKVLQAQYVLAVNLTSDFGSGNEPTKEQMDTLLSGMTNHWFDGTIEIDPIS